MVFLQHQIQIYTDDGEIFLEQQNSNGTNDLIQLSADQIESIVTALQKAVHEIRKREVSIDDSLPQT